MTDHPITQLISSAQRGDPLAAEKLWASVYDEIRILAQRALDKEYSNVSLQATELAHEAYLRLTGDAQLTFQKRVHLLATVARVIRRLLIDRARYRKANKRGGHFVRILLDDIIESAPENAPELIDLNEAIEELEAIDPRHGRLVELRFFGGMTLDEAADALGVSRRTVAGDWALARAWLRRRLEIPNP